MDIDSEHSFLRKQLDILGYNQPLPIGSLTLVSAILNDLVQTTESLKKAKDELNSLLEEREAWSLGVEPYKCDNSRLLSECNGLHMELMRQRDKFELKMVDQRHQIRTLEIDKQYLEDHCEKLGKRIEVLEGKHHPPKLHDPKISKIRNENRKPFISTVRASASVPNRLAARDTNWVNRKCVSCSKCGNNPSVIDENLQFEFQRIQRDNETKMDMIKTLQGQENI